MQTSAKSARRQRARGTLDWRKLESKWQKKWAEAKIFETDPKPDRPKFFVTVAYPYVNSPQHIGHGRTYTMGDVDARYHRMRGYNTLFPIAFHYTGTPIAAMSKRLSQADPEIIETFTRIYHVPSSKLDEMKDPLRLARYFHEEIRKGMKEIGFSFDWRREFSTVDPLYKRFIQWQFRRLRDNGRITRGTHPVGWCTNDNGPVGMHDTMGDVEPEIGEFFLVKFEQDGIVFPTATLRPETVFGVTNLWINPDAQYVQAEVDGERWIVSKDTVQKLQLQNRKVAVEKELSTNDLLGSTVFNPVIRRKIPIFPGAFVDPKNGTGVVMSVPGHAPYDYQALEDLKSRAGPMVNAVLGWDEIKPVSIIQLDGYSDIPAADAVKKFHVQSQEDPKLEQATKEIYSAEYHRGVMKQNTGAYSGMNVAKARDTVVQDFTSQGLITKMYEILNRPVICRCGTEVLVKILSDQWFLDYGEADWKKLAHECLDNMTLLPEDIRPQFEYAIDWLKEKACARRVGLGTPLPWDPSWVIEALSDSTIYMAYYILSKYLSREWMTFKKFEKAPEKLMDEFFDYIFLGRGDPGEVSTITDIPKRVVEGIRREFEYFYPVDMRHSAKELIPNHFSFYIFNHVALFPRKHWPKGIAANGHVLMNGQKMSKSLQNIIPLRQAIQTFGADPVRIGVLVTAEMGQDTDFSEQLARSIEERLMNLLVQAKKLGISRGKKKSGRPVSILDKWMLHMLNEMVKQATNAMDSLRVRETIQRVLYQMDNYIAWYLKRLGPLKRGINSRDLVLRKILEVRARILSPLSPHVAEEVWSLLGGRGFVSIAPWPEPDDRSLYPEAEISENFVKQVLEDTIEIMKATGIKPKTIMYYTAPDWKWKTYLRALEFANSGTDASRVGDFVKMIMSDPEIRSEGKLAADYANKSFQQARQLKELRSSRVKTGSVDEAGILEDAKEFFQREFKASVKVRKGGTKEIDDPKSKAKTAEPYRPAIYIEE